MKGRSDFMDSMIQLITGGVNEWTPSVMVGLIVFCLVLECISSIAFQITSVGRR